MQSLILALIALSAIVNAQVITTKQCYYSSNSEDSFEWYQFQMLGSDNQGWLNGTDANGDVWNFRICDQDQFDTDNENPCPDDSSVCVLSNGKTQTRGSTASVQFSDTPYPDTFGFEVIFGAEIDNQDYKTVIEFVCGWGLPEPIVSIQLDGTYTTIIVNTTYACPESSDVTDPRVEMQVDFAFLFFSLLMLFGLVCSLCCCCCLVRRRRCQRNKDIAMKQFSNVAFQPIPSALTTQSTTTSSIQQHTVPLPAYNPYLIHPQQQQQFVYYYPSQNQQVATTTINTPPTVQLDDDEKLAKQLQAQFDQEVQV